MARCWSRAESLRAAELYDPITGTWSATDNLSVTRTFHRAILLPNGKVLVAGGFDNTGQSLASAELYDPAAGTWSLTASLEVAHGSTSATLLLDGRVLIVSGIAGGITPKAELYDVGLAFSSDWQPQIRRMSLVLASGHRHLRLIGSRFQGISQASGGNTQDSSSNYPIVQLRSLDSEQVAFLPVDPESGWSDTRFRSIPVSDFPKGPALVTVFTNGIPSEARYLLIANHRR